MTDNIITSEDVNPKPVKKAPAKKAAAKKAEAPQKATENGSVVVVFESGASYSSNGIRFTKDNRIQEVSGEDAKVLLELDNFRFPTEEELKEYFASKEG